MRFNLIIAIPCLLLAVSAAGCVGSRPLVEAPLTETTVLEAPFEEVWLATRSALTQENLRIYTRDKRGQFVAYGEEKRRFRLVPRRTQFTVTLERLSSEQTRVFVESVRQHYRVTLLSHPDWRDVASGVLPESGRSILDSIEGILSGDQGESGVTS